MTEASTDSALCDACRKGDARAWHALVDRYSRLVFSVPRRYGLSTQDCDDIHQAALAALVLAIGKGERIDRVGAWLAKVAHRESWRIGRQRSRTLAMSDFDSVAEPSPAVARDIEQEQAVRDALDALGSPCRELLTALFSCSGEPHYPTISGQLGMPVGSIGPTRARCLGRLERILRDRGICDLAPDTE
jgi:RNA polymerase sigma factor (sigma-70 family)